MSYEVELRVYVFWPKTQGSIHLITGIVCKNKKGQDDSYEYQVTIWKEKCPL